MILASWLENLRSTRFWGIGSRRTPRSIRRRFRRWNDWNPKPIDIVQRLEDRTMLTLPTGVVDSYFFEQDTADVSMDVLDNDIDPDGMGLTISTPTEWV